MKILNVIPIAKSIPHETLSYFTSKDVRVGSLVTVPVRDKNLPAIVVSTSDAKDAKSAIKQTGFALKPIKSIKSNSFLDEAFMEACQEIAHYFVSPIGAVLKDLIPTAILTNAEKIIETKTITASDTQNENNKKTNSDDSRQRTILAQASKEDRFQYYKSVIREEFAKNNSVFFCLPTVTEIEESAAELSKGIEKYSIVLHNNLPAKKITELWNAATQEKHPVLIVATKSFLSLPRKDISAIILDRENSPLYKLERRPYIDIRVAAEIISQKKKNKLILGDFLLSTETFYRQETGEVAPSITPVSRMLSSAEQIIVDMKKKNQDDWQKRVESAILSSELKKMIDEASRNNEKIILFVNRRGYSPTTVCNDCQRTILCQNCDTPLVLHAGTSNLTAKTQSKTSDSTVKTQTSKSSKHICHKCLTETPVYEQCPYCKSWRLDSFGIGIQKATEEITKAFPKLKLFVFDSDSIKNEKQGKKIAEDFMASPGSAIIGTEMLFSYIKQPVERAAIISLDASFAIPDFKINEKIFQILLKLRSLAQKTFLIQTRMPEQEIFSEAMRGNISGFYKTETDNRQKFKYPPFSLLIKVSKEEKSKEDARKKIETLASKTQEWQPLSYPAFSQKVKGLYKWNLLLRLNQKSWIITPKQSEGGPNKQTTLHQLLSSLPPGWKVDVSPGSLL